MKIVDAAKYFIYLASKEKAYSLTPLKLQKLLYYAQGFSFVWDNKALFREEFEAWQYGPVNREIYSMYQKYGPNEIPSFEGESVKAKADEIETIKAVWQRYKKFSAFELVEKTHQEGPWKDAIINSRIISNEKIKEYFNRAYN